MIPDPGGSSGDNGTRLRRSGRAVGLRGWRKVGKLSGPFRAGKEEANRLPRGRETKLSLCKCFLVLGLRNVCFPIPPHTPPHTETIPGTPPPASCPALKDRAKNQSPVN